MIAEPLGGAHRDPQKMGEILKERINRNLKELKEKNLAELLKLRYKKFRSIGVTG
jgi:acetyl-CoA carboxylase carboxyl transferase subunit alpha